jgi:hypothetical protein
MDIKNAKHGAKMCILLLKQGMGTYLQGKLSLQGPNSKKPRA